MPKYRTKKPAQVMMLAVIVSTGTVMPPQFFAPSETVTADVRMRLDYVSDLGQILKS